MKFKLNTLKTARAAKPLKRAVANQLNKADAAQYKKWLKQNTFTESELVEQKRQSSKFNYKPLISIIVPTYNTQEKYFKEMIESVTSQTYGNWEIVFIDDASPDKTPRELIKSYGKSEKRITYKFLEKTHHIAEATNYGIKLAKGEFISLLDHDDILLPNALFEIVKSLNTQKDLDFIYTDEDKITEDGNVRMQPFFKPDWSPDLLRSINYITHFTTIRKTLLDKVGYEDGMYNGAQDWELFLRATRNLGKDKIHHIPQILYSWRVHENSTAKSLEIKPYVRESQRRALTDDLKKRGIKNFKLDQDPLYPAQWQVRFTPLATPKVWIVVTNPLIVKQVALQIHQNTNYKDYDIEVINQHTTYKTILAGKLDDFLLFIDRKLNITDTNWIEDLLGDAARPEIGLVLARVSSSESINNAAKIINQSAKPLIYSMSRLAFSRHIYKTTRYNQILINGGVTMVEAKKLTSALENNLDAQFSLNQASTALSDAEYFNLYNPYIKVVV